MERDRAIRRLLGSAALFFAIAGAAAAAGPAAPARKGVLQFNRDVLPILADRCFACHGPGVKQPGGGLRLDRRDLATAKSAGRAAAIVPGKPEASELVRRVHASGPGLMPPAATQKTLTAVEKRILRDWVGQGAPYQAHWSLLPPVRAALPAVRDRSWPRNPIDHFVLARLEREGLPPSAEADRATLIRRVTLDLTGLPPTPEEVAAFQADRSATAYENVVDRLLDSPRFGERMAWDWLDAARYADTNGYQGDRTRTMWPWRDWVVRAFNRDLPLDQFTVEQLAGDLLPNPTTDQRIATGFNRNHLLNGEGGRIPEESRIEYVVDRVDTTATVWMGLTFGCARCHDHKYDPFSQKEYYQLFAYFNNVPETGSVDRGGNAAPVLPLPTPEQAAQLKALDEQDLALSRRASPLPANSPERAAIAKELEGVRKKRKELADSQIATMVMEERIPPRDTFVLVRGAYDKPADKVSHGVPASLPPLASDAPRNRLALARWLVDPAHPLTTRVLVNRYWQLFFGTGLVKTAEDFGIQGERPSHPELLDWLAVALKEPPRARSAEDTPPSSLGWSLKRLCRLIVTSATYRQSSRLPAAGRAASDPENRLVARGPRFRLSSSVIRDQALAISGLLVEKQGGPPVKPYQPEGVWEDATFGKITYEQDHGEKLYRRSLYTFWRRIVGPTMFFDTAARQTCSVRQTRTNSPLHALVLLNDTTYVEAARAFAQRILREGGAGDDTRLDLAFRLAAARPPSASERGILKQRLNTLRGQYSGDPASARKLLSVGEAPRDPGLDPVEHAAYTGICALILNLDEVITKE
jgi:hypothetical protein